MKRENNLQPLDKREEDAWNKEVYEIRQATLCLWQDLLTLESYHCLDIQDQVNFFEEVRKFETSLIKRVLLHTKGSQIKSARLLGITTSTLNSKIKRYQIPIKPTLHKLPFAGIN